MQSVDMIYSEYKDGNGHTCEVDVRLIDSERVEACVYGRMDSMCVCVYE